MTEHQLKSIFYKLESGIPVKQIAKAHKVCSNTLYIWRKQGYEMTAIKLSRCLTEGEKKQAIIEKYNKILKKDFEVLQSIDIKVK